MEFIPPAEISGKIMTLIDQAQKELILISPYNKIIHWKKLINRITKAQERGVSITWYIRKHTENNAEHVLRLGITPIEIENLHCKLYLNEKHAVVTSMNLHEFSDNSSIDIGYYVTEQDKYAELKEFVKTHISADQAKVIRTKISNYYASNASFFHILESELNLQGFQVRTMPDNVIIIENFIYKGMELYFEPKGGYYRIDFRINQSYKTRDLIFNNLNARNEILQHDVDTRISFGTQMKRLKFDIDIFENYQYPAWALKEFKTMWPHAISILHMLKTELQTDLYKGLLKN